MYSFKNAIVNIYLDIYLLRRKSYSHYSPT